MSGPCRGRQRVVAGRRITRRLRPEDVILSTGCALTLAALLGRRASAAIPFVQENVDATGSVGEFASLALDAEGNPRIGCFENTRFDLKYASAAIEISDSSPGVVWPVGSRRAVHWDGTGRVELSLSTDGGRTYEALATTLTGGEYRFTVPHGPSRFCKLRLKRTVPPSVADVDSFFTIETSIELLGFSAEPPPDGGSGTLLTWASDPGPEDLVGDKLERAGLATPGGLGGGPAEAEVALFDVAGRRARTVARQLYPAGCQSVVWDGRDDEGRPVASGTYFLRASSPGHEKRMKLVVMR